MASAFFLPTIVVFAGTILYLAVRPLIASRRQAQAQARKEQETRRNKMIEEALADQVPVYRTGPPDDVRELRRAMEFGYQFGRTDPRNERFRARFGSSGAYLEGLPACGGLYTLTPTGVELDFLGIDRFHSVERPTDGRGERGAAEEEAFCDKLRLLGAEWIPNTYAQLKESTQEDIYLMVGWEPLPGSSLAEVKAEDVSGCGVWVLKVSERESYNKEIGMVRYARSMEERCRILERLGATFYKNPKECPDLNLP